jgi:membrane protease YdiL (CAAX protease family)
MSSHIVAVALALAFLGSLAPFGGLRFLAQDFVGRRRQAVGALSLIGILSVAVFDPAVSSETLGNIQPEQIWFPALFAGHFLLATFLVAWWRLGHRRSLASFLHLDSSSLGDLWLGSRVGVAGWCLTIVTMVTIGLAIMPLSAGDATQEAPTFMLWLADLPLNHKLLIIVAAMTVEEAFFRGFLQPRVGWIPSTLLFAVAHASYGMPIMLVGVFVISLVIGWLFRRTGRLLPCIVAHGVFDAIQLLVVIPLAVELAARGGWVVA